MNRRVKNKILPIILIILDGWGIAKDDKNNPISMAKTPTYDFFTKNFAQAKLKASGQYVGLLKNQDGNSEAGHSNIGAGRIVEQDVLRINKTIKNGTFFKNPALVEALNHAKKYKSNIHLLGLLSDGQSAHSQPNHLYALLDFFKLNKFDRVYLHLFTDGRDSSMHAAARMIVKLKDNFENNEIISTIIGRYYAMDRIKAWQRTQLAYNAMVLGQGIAADNPYKAITNSYDRGESDEYITPTVIINPDKKPEFINHNDSIIFFNLRSDRARQLTKPFVQKNFEKLNTKSFKRKKILKNLKFVGMTDFGQDLDSVLSAFPSANLQNTLPIVLEELKQLYVSEREKYAHITYFFNGGYNQPVNGEKWQVFDSVGKTNYVETPQMSSHLITNFIIKELAKYDFITVNYPNPDMLGHTGNLKAAIKAIEIVDQQLAKLYNKIKKMEGTMIITADHGNVEEMLNSKTGEVDTEHSTNPVPFMIINQNLKNTNKLKKNGILADIAPTILDLLKIKQPKKMTGQSLLK